MGVLRKRSSENMQQIYKRTSVRKYEVLIFETNKIKIWNFYLKVKIDKMKSTVKNHYECTKKLIKTSSYDPFNQLLILGTNV